MRLGCCGTLDDAGIIKSAGFDFLEVNVQAVLRGDEPSEVYDKNAPNPAKLPLPIEAANCLVPGSRPIVGPKRDMTGLQDYMQRVSKRAQRLGIKRFVFGSGGARKRPEGIDSTVATEHLTEFARMAGEVCAHHGIILVIEHLNKGETNTLNSLADCMHLCERVNHPNVQMLVDSYHFGLEKETDRALLNLQSTLCHVHVAEVVTRAEPGANAGTADAFDFDDFFCLLRKVGYDERIAVECNWRTPMPQAARAVCEFLRAAWERAGKCESNVV